MDIFKLWRALSDSEREELSRLVKSGITCGELADNYSGKMSVRLRNILGFTCPNVLIEDVTRLRFKVIRGAGTATWYEFDEIRNKLIKK